MSYIGNAPSFHAHGEYAGAVVSGPGLDDQFGNLPKIVDVDHANGLVKIRWDEVVHQTFTGTQEIDGVGTLDKYDQEIHTFTAEIAISNIADVATSHRSQYGNPSSELNRATDF